MRQHADGDTRGAVDRDNQRQVQMVRRNLPNHQTLTKRQTFAHKKYPEASPCPFPQTPHTSFSLIPVYSYVPASPSPAKSASQISLQFAHLSPSPPSSFKGFPSPASLHKPLNGSPCGHPGALQFTLHSIARRVFPMPI